MEKMNVVEANWHAKETWSEDETEKCCGKCRFGRTTPELEMKCMRHKIQTDYVCRCGDWQGKEPA